MVIDKTDSLEQILFFLFWKSVKENRNLKTFICPLTSYFAIFKHNSSLYLNNYSL